LVRFRDGTIRDETGKDVSGNVMGDIGSGAELAAGTTPEGVIEEILPRKTVLTRADSFKGTNQQPIIANAEQVLIVASIRQPYAKWGLIDRMLIAAESGGLKPIVCLNKLDLALAEEDQPPADLTEAEEVLSHYATLGIRVLRTSVIRNIGIDELRETLTNRVTVLAGHSGVGKSSLVRAMQPSLDLKVGEVSRYTDKGRHTTTSARQYPLDGGGVVIDTPGVKQFGLWGVTRDNLEDFFPDVASGTAPEWRKLSFQRIAESLSA
jgi:ribosome biogenesis GTPase